jgi:DNA-binding GntR family transcriptional regulator
VPTSQPWKLETAFAGIPPLARRVATGLLEGIVTERYPPGSILTEVEVAHDAGVSRTPAREALLALERAGLVRLMPKKGAAVTPISAQQARDLVGMRALFETAAVRRLVRHPECAEALYEDLAATLTEQHAAEQAGELLRFAAADFAFHARIVQETANAVISDTFAELAPRLARLTYSVVTSSPGVPRRLYEEHVRLAALARDASLDAFHAELNEHLDASYGAL